MKLLIISHTEHYKKDGTIVGWGPTIREVNYLARLFDEVVHVATLQGGPAPDSALPYDFDKIRFSPVPASGGNRLVDKLSILVQYPRYLWTILKELRSQCRTYSLSSQYQPAGGSADYAAALAATPLDKIRR